MHLCTHRKQTGFTLIEVLLVIAILAILASIVIVAINPAKHFEESRDTERYADVYTIMQAIYQYAADTEGEFPSSITTEFQEVCKTGAPSCTGLLDLSILTTNEAYMITIPTDPQCDSEPSVCSTNGTGYFVARTLNGRIVVYASSSETEVIEVTQ